LPDRKETRDQGNAAESPLGRQIIAIIRQKEFVSKQNMDGMREILNPANWKLHWKLPDKDLREKPEIRCCMICYFPLDQASQLIRKSLSLPYLTY
jgi:hypothetical protein